MTLEESGGTSFQMHGISGEVNLNLLVNLALSSSPKAGIVNFNILKTFLIELLKALNLQNFEPKFSDVSESQVILEAINNDAQHESLMNLIGGNNERDSNQIMNNISRPMLTSDVKAISAERFHALEDKMSRFEQQMVSLNALPSNQKLIEKSKDLRKNPANSGPIVEAWQYTQLSKRLELNEDGLTKVIRKDFLLRIV